MDGRSDGTGHAFQDLGDVVLVHVVSVLQSYVLRDVVGAGEAAEQRVVDVFSAAQRRKVETVEFAAAERSFGVVGAGLGHSNGHLHL